MYKKVKFSIAILLIFFITSCAIPMSSSSFESEARRISSTKTFKVGAKSEVLYKGSDEKYHYFYMSSNFGIHRSVKVKKSDLLINNEFPYTSESDKWVDYDFVN